MLDSRTVIDNSTQLDADVVLRVVVEPLEVSVEG